MVPGTQEYEMLAKMISWPNDGTKQFTMMTVSHTKIKKSIVSLANFFLLSCIIVLAG